MKKTALLAAVSAFALVPSIASAAPTEVSHYAGNGAYATFSSYDSDSYSHVSVSRGGTAQNQTTYLDFYMSSCTYTDTSYSCTGASGWGQIPSGDFVEHGSSGNADLVTDTSGIYAYAYSYSCDFTTWQCTFSEAPAPAGLISVSWSKTNEYKFTNEGRSESDYLNFRYMTQGQTTTSSASVEGDVFGQPITSAFGSVGTSRNLSISIVRSH